MVWHRTTARGVLILLLPWVLAGTAQAGEPPDRIIFPVVGTVAYTDDFGDPRGQGAHQGNDIMAPRRALAVAAERGRVEFHTTSSRAGCMLYLYGASGTTYLYIHLNNDLTRSNDNRGGCVQGVAYARRLQSGQRVRAGQLLGYVGDSGDADGISPHLHFELHPNGGGAVSPYRWLQAARRVIFAVPGYMREARLTLWGIARASENGELTVGVRRVGMANGWRATVRRRVVLATAPAVLVERLVSGARRPASLESVRIGERIVVTTTAFEPTLRTQLARPGALAAEHVLLRG
jgi:hypothetical protein